METKTSMDIAPIVGAWELASFEIRRENGEVIYPFGENAKGSIIYTNTSRFSAQVMRADRPPFASEDQMAGTPEEVDANFKGVISYYGTYTIDQSA